MFLEFNDGKNEISDNEIYIIATGICPACILGCENSCGAACWNSCAKNATRE